MTSPFRWTLPLAAAFACGQETAPFPPDLDKPWQPTWEVTLRSDQVSDPTEAAEGFRRVRAQLRLRWSWESGGCRLVAGTRSALGSDGNRFNAARWDQQPSNGTQLDMAHADGAWVSGRSFGAVSMGFQENGLLVSQALWDRDLRFLGIGGMAGFRGAGEVLQEASLRGALGRVRNLLGGRVDFSAGQLVLKLDTGAWSWTAHGGRWNLSWDPGEERLRRLPSQDTLARQKLVLDAAGASARWNTVLPLEARWFGSKNRESKESSEEVQGTVGSKERTFWPQVSYTWQKLSSTGTLYPVNGDEWWFYRRTQGHRVDLSVPLPGQWLVSLVFIRQRWNDDAYQVTRKTLNLIKRF